MDLQIEAPKCFYPGYPVALGRLNLAFQLKVQCAHVTIFHRQTEQSKELRNQCAFEKMHVSLNLNIRMNILSYGS